MNLIAKLLRRKPETKPLSSEEYKAIIGKATKPYENEPAYQYDGLDTELN